MSLVRIFHEMWDDPCPQIFTDGGDPGGMSGSLRIRKKRRSAGHRSRMGSQARAPSPSQMRKEHAHACGGGEEEQHLPVDEIDPSHELTVGFD